MKKLSFIKACTFVGLVLATLLMIGCSNNREKEYYADKNNYITDEAVIDNIIYNEEKGYIVFWLSEIDEAYQTHDFIIEGNSVAIVLQNGLKDKVQIGSRITYTSAPRIFGNGDFMPIIGLSVAGAELLGVEEGYNNLMELY